MAEVRYCIQRKRGVELCKVFDLKVMSFLKKHQLRLTPSQAAALQTLTSIIIPDALRTVVSINGKRRFMYQFKPTYGISSTDVLLRDAMEDYSNSESSLLILQNGLVKVLSAKEFYEQIAERLDNRPVRILKSDSLNLQKAMRSKILLFKSIYDRQYSYYLVSVTADKLYNEFKQIVSDFIDDNPLDLINKEELFLSGFWFDFSRMLFLERYQKIGNWYVGQRPAIQATSYWNDNELSVNHKGITYQFTLWFQFRLKVDNWKVLKVPGSDPCAQLFDRPINEMGDGSLVKVLSIKEFYDEFIDAARVDGHHLGFVDYSSAKRSQIMNVVNGHFLAKYDYGILD